MSMGRLTSADTARLKGEALRPADFSHCIFFTVRSIKKFFIFCALSFETRKFIKSVFSI